MKVAFDVRLWDESSDGRRGFASLEMDLPFAPTSDMEFQQSVWHEPRRPTSVCWDIGEESFKVRLGIDRLHSNDEFETYVRMYRDHGWNVEVF